MPTPFRPGSFLDRLAGGSQQRSVPFPDAGYFTDRGRPPLFRAGESLNAYGDNVWLYSAVNVLSDELARTPFRLQKRTAKGELQFVERHQAIETMRRPQVTEGGKSLLTGMMLKKVTGMHLLLNGEGFWWLRDRMKLSGSPLRIDLLLPEYVRTVESEAGELVAYAYRLPQREIVIDPLEVVHFRLPDPSRWVRGHAPTSAIRYAIDTNKEADLMNFRRFLNNALPGGLLKPQSSLSDEQIKKLRTQWNALHGGSGNAGKTAVMPANVEFQAVQQTNQEMQFVEGKDQIQKEILATYRVGPEMLGMTDSQTRANAEAAIFVFERFGALPFIEAFADSLTNDYLPAFPGTDGLEFGFPDPVPENMEEKRLNAETLFRNGAITPNEFRKMFGLEPLNRDGMDSPYLPISMGEVGAEDVAPNLPVDLAA